MSAGASVGRSPCTLTMIVGAAVRIGAAERLEDAVGAGGVVGARHHRAAAGLLDRGGDRFANRSPPPPARRRPPRARAQHVHDHRLAARCRRAACRAGAVEAMRAGMRMRTSLPAIAGSSAARQIAAQW